MSELGKLLLVRSCVAFPGIAGAASVAHAQLGTGWTKHTLTADYIDTQSRGQHARHPIASFETSGARYEKNGDTETFESSTRASTASSTTRTTTTAPAACSSRAPSRSTPG